MPKRPQFSYSPPEPLDGPRIWFVFAGFRLLVEERTPDVWVPSVAHPRELGVQLVREQYLGTFNGRHLFAGEVETPDAAPEGLAFLGLRRLFGRLDDRFLAIASRAVQLVDWDRNHLYCGHCAAPTRRSPNEVVRACTQCERTFYPRISPAIIVAIMRDDELLLARNQRHPDGWFSVLAGFVEPGETLEQTVAREVFEEVGLQVGNIRYFGSQPWPFPNSLMIGFLADYAGGEIAVDGVEITEAAWFKADHLPHRPSSAVSISGELIDWFVDLQNGNTKG